MILRDASGNIIWTEDNIDQSTSDIFDANGNELLKFVSVADAVNEWTITNAAAAQAPMFSATGGDVDVDGKIEAKGAGTLLLDGGATGTVDIGTTSTGNINLKRNTVADLNLSVTGNTALTGTLGVTGASTFTGAVTTASTLATTGVVTINGGLTVTSGRAFNLIPAGFLAFMANTTVPTGWLECDGSAVNRVTYATLFTAIGTTYGVGDGATTFNVPTQARRTLVGRGGAGTATLANTVGSTGGAETVTLTVANMPAGVPQTGGAVGSINVVTGAGVTVPNTAASWGAGGGTATSILQPSLVGMLVIRAY
jgi:microcystin-dependent protein